MTTTEFHNALLQGRGSCWLAARSDPEKYRDEVLWACRELVSFDTQCEGTRAWLVHQLVLLYPDRTPFVEAACDALVHCPRWAAAGCSPMSFWRSASTIPATRSAPTPAAAGTEEISNKTHSSPVLGSFFLDFFL